MHFELWSSASKVGVGRDAHVSRDAWAHRHPEQTPPTVEYIRVAGPTIGALSTVLRAA
jgi:hypothetical protein